MRNWSNAGNAAVSRSRAWTLTIPAERACRHLDARRKRQHAGLQRDAGTALAIPVGQVVDDEIELVAANRERAQRAAFHPSRIVPLQQAHRALDILGLELGGAAHERLVLEAQVRRRAQRQRDAEQHQQKEPADEASHVAGTGLRSARSAIARARPVKITVCAGPSAYQ